jgi:transposase InsO family protein
MLTVIDEYTREALSVTVANTMGSSEVLEALYPLLLKRGKPEYLRSDNGPEFSSEPFKEWLTQVSIKPIQIYPGSPWENGYNERFNGTLRREVLNAEWFGTTRQAQTVINQWLKQYNKIRPHQALRIRPPVPETILENRQISGT